MAQSGRTLRRALALVLGLSVFGPAVAGQSYDYHRETFLLYISGGPSFPVGDAGHAYSPGWHAGLGVGIVVATDISPSPELALKLDFTRHTAKGIPRLWSWATEEWLTLITFETRFRIQNGKLFRPFLSAGFGVEADEWAASSAGVLGIGADMATNSDGVRTLYFEIRYLNSGRSFLRLDIGIRLG